MFWPVGRAAGSPWAPVPAVISCNGNFVSVGKLTACTGPPFTENSSVSYYLFLVRALKHSLFLFLFLSSIPHILKPSRSKEKAVSKIWKRILNYGIRNTPYVRIPTTQPRHGSCIIKGKINNNAVTWTTLLAVTGAGCSSLRIPN